MEEPPVNEPDLAADLARCRSYLLAIARVELPRYLRGKGEMGIVLVEQYFEWARDLCDSYAVMDRGQVVLAGTRAGMVEADVLRWMSV